MIRRWIIILSLVVFFTGTLFGLWELREEFRHDQGEVRGTILWIATEVDREYWRFLDALSRYSLGDRTTTHDDLLLRFDIFWGQLNTFKSGDLGHRLMTAGKGKETVAEIDATLTDLEPELNALQHGDAKAGAALRERMAHSGTLIHQMVQRIDKSENAYFVGVFNQTENSLDNLSWLVLSMSFTGAFMIVLLIKEKNRANRMYALAKDAEQHVREMNTLLEQKVNDRTADLQEEILKRKRKEESLRQSEERLNLALEAVSDAVWDWRLDTQNVHFNPGWYKILGYQPYELPQEYATWKNLIHPNDQDRADQVVSRHLEIDEPFNMEFRMKTKDDKWKWIMGRGKVVERDSNGNAMRMIGTNVDITERKEIEAQLKDSEEIIRQSQKLEAIGTLAGGIAHDFNNILSAILGYTELALMEKQLDTSLKNRLDAIYSSGVRARDLIGQILAFSRKEERVRTPVELASIVKDAIKLLRPAIPTTIDIQIQISSKCHIMGDPSRIHQIIMNLGTNAYQSMLETGGTLSITLAQVEMKGEAADLSNIPCGAYGKLTVSDTGMGIPAENIDRIFEPYFTTKEKGKGTGLGLAAVHGIVKSHGGTILVESKIGQGTTFEVYLPLTRELDDKEPSYKSQLRGGNERILLVDDEPDILTVTKEMLEKLGYMLKTAGSAHEALKLFAENPDQFDLVVTDMTMPKMTGDKLSGELQKIRSGIPILLCTGFSELITKEKAASLGIEGFLMKPAELKDLSAMVRNILDKQED